MNKIIDIYEKIHYQHYLLTLDMVSISEICFFANFLQKRISNSIGGKILDLGCGCGRDVGIFAGLGFEVVGVDFCSNSINFCKKYHNNNLTSFLNCDILGLDFKTEADGIWCSFVLSHYDFGYFCKSIEKFCEYLGVDGILFLGLRDYDGGRLEWSEELGVWREYYGFSYQDVESVLSKNNMSIIYYRWANEQKEFGEAYRNINRHFIIAQKIC